MPPAVSWTIPARMTACGTMRDSLREDRTLNNEFALIVGSLLLSFSVAALLSPRPPELMILNEPEGSLHPELLAPLARLRVEQPKAAVSSSARY